MDLSEARWHKSTRSNSTGGNCVEVADNLAEWIYVRDTKDNDRGPILTFSREAWREFIAHTKKR